jgi:hypothetical protein
VESRVADQPCLDLRVLVGDVVVHDQVQVQVGRSLLVDLTQEVQELLMPMVLTHSRDHLPVGDVQRRGESRSTVSSGVVSDALDLSETHRQQRLWLFSSTHSTSA